MSTSNNDSIVITGFGTMVPGAYGYENFPAAMQANPQSMSEWRLGMEDFSPLPFMSDKRMLKALSRRDAVGVAAVEDCRKQVGLPAGQYAPERMAMYVGAPQSNSSDNHYYVDAIEQTKDATGTYHEKQFGATCMNSKPTTLLLGLPNNVLCYGAMVLDARGPNSNYTSGELSSHMALMLGARQLRRDRADIAVVGGYAQHSDPVTVEMLKRNGWMNGPSRFATGAVFMTLERQSAALKRQAKVHMRYVDTKVRSLGGGPLLDGANTGTVTNCIQDLLQATQVDPQHIGIVAMSGHDVPQLEATEWSAVKNAFGANLNNVVLLAAARGFGQLMEAGGLVELPIMARIAEHGQIPAALLAPESALQFDKSKRYGLIVRSSYFGDASAVLVELLGGQS